MRRRYSTKAIAIIEIVHAVIWAGAIVAASALWGDLPEAPTIVVWGVVGYVLANGVLLAVLLRRVK